MSNSSAHKIKSNLNWKVNDIIDSSAIESFDGGYINSTEDYHQLQQQPQKIASRRRSERLSLKRLANDNSNAGKSESNGPPGKQKRKKIPTPEKSMQTAEIQLQNVDWTNVLTTKNELSKAVYGLFAEFQQDKKNSKNFTAKCTLCDESEDARISFTKGINSNLKSHLTRVSKPYFCFHLIGLLFKWKLNFIVYCYK